MLFIINNYTIISSKYLIEISFLIKFITINNISSPHFHKRLINNWLIKYLIKVINILK